MTSIFYYFRNENRFSVPRSFNSETFPRKTSVNDFFPDKTINDDLSEENIPQSNHNVYQDGKSINDNFSSDMPSSYNSVSQKEQIPFNGRSAFTDQSIDVNLLDNLPEESLNSGFSKYGSAAKRRKLNFETSFLTSQSGKILHFFCLKIFYCRL